MHYPMVFHALEPLMTPSRSLLRAFALSFALAAAGTACAHPYDRSNNPPGPAGGPGTHWENPPGWRGGPGTSPDDRYYRHHNTRYRFTVVDGGYYFNSNFGYWHPRYGWWNQSSRCWRDSDNNPPGPAGGRGTNWENPPGRKGGPGASPDRYRRCR